MSRLRLEEELVKKEASLNDLEDKPIAQLIQEAQQIDGMPDVDMLDMPLIEASTW